MDGHQEEEAHGLHWDGDAPASESSESATDERDEGTALSMDRTDELNQEKAEEAGYDNERHEGGGLLWVLSGDERGLAGVH